MSSTTKGNVFISGGSGFIAAAIIDQLITDGYHVTTSVRNAEKARQIQELHPEYKEKIKFVTVPDISTSRAFDAVFNSEEQSFRYVIHTASPVKFDAENLQKEIIDPAVNGTVGCLESAHKYGGDTIERFILLGSVAAVENSHADLSVTGPAYTEADWNPVTVEEAITTRNPVLVYNVSKKDGEKGAWAFMEKNKPAFDLTVLNPDVVIGPLMQPVTSPKAINETNAYVYKYFNGTFKEIVEWPFYHYIDVRDLAKAHVLALTTPAAGNKRIICGSQDLYSGQAIANILRDNFPSLRDTVVKGEPNRLIPAGIYPRAWDTTRFFEVFGKDWKPIPLEKTVVDLVKSFQEYEKRWA